MASLRALRGICSFVSAAGLLVTQSAGQGPVYKLNPPLAREVTNELRDARISPDGTWLVYRADPEREYELYCVPVKGGREPIRLDARIEPHERFEITRDSRFVLYASHDFSTFVDKIYRVSIEGERDPVELALGSYFLVTPDGRSILFQSGWSTFLLPLDGSSGPRLLLPPVVGTYNGHFQFSPDGRRLVYHSAREREELFSVPTDGSSAPVKLSGPLVAGGSVRSSKVSPDGTRVVYEADQDTDRIHELYSVPIDGSAPSVELNPTFTAETWLTWYEVLPDGSRVIFTADPEERYRFDIFSVPIGGGQVVKLNRPFPAGGAISIPFSITPDGSRVVYVGEQDVDGVSEAFVVASDGSFGPTRLNDPLAPGESIGQGGLSPDGSRFVYQAASVLYSVPTLRDVAATPLSGRVTTSSGGSISPDGTRVVFEGSLDGSDGLFSVPIEGGREPFQLEGRVGNRFDFQFTPDSQRLVLRVEESPDVIDLFSVPVDGREPAVQLSAPFDGGETIADVFDFQLTSDGSRAVLGITIPNTDGEYRSNELYSVTLDEREPVKLFPAGTIGQGFHDDLELVLLTPDSGRVVFHAGDAEDDEGVEDYDLFSAPLDGHLPPVQLNDRHTGFAPFELAPAGGHVVFFQQDAQGAAQLFAVPDDGSAAPTQLTTGGASSFRISPDGTRLAFAAAGATNQESALFSVPIDASTAPIQLVPTLTNPRGNPYELRISADSRLVVYRTDQMVGNAFELYAVPIDGSSPSRRLSGALVGGGDVQPGFLLVCDEVGGSRALYRGDQDFDERNELYSVPLDGSSPPVKLSGTLTPRGDVREPFQVSPDGSRVVFLADQQVDETVELFSAPVDGSSAPVKLNGVLPSGGDVAFVLTSGLPFRISPDGTRVVYRADQVRDEVHELYSVPIDGSGPPLQISGFLPAGGDVLGGFEISADGLEVLYVADQQADDVFELFRTPIDRIKESRRASARLVEGGDVLDGSGRPRIRIAPDSKRVLYLADQDVDAVLELYVTSPGRRQAFLLPR